MTLKINIYKVNKKEEHDERIVLIERVNARKDGLFVSWHVTGGKNCFSKRDWMEKMFRLMKIFCS
jgi:hypothetical protein